MVILGIDPGYARVGFGAIRMENSKLQHMGNGTIETCADEIFTHRLEYIFDSMINMINKCKPDVIAIEKLYFQNNQKTAIDVSQARGVILLAAKKCGIPVYEYTPLQVKTVITGYGKAEKKQIMYMIKKLLALEKMPKYDDAADALAIALCHAQSAGRERILKLLNK